MGGDVWTDRLVELEEASCQSLGGVTLQVPEVSVNCLVPNTNNANSLYLSSASFSGPVDTGLRNPARSPDFRTFTALQRIVETMVLPTSVLAPYTWWAERQSAAPTGAMGNKQ